jgi:hypothetical protein
MLTAAGTNQHGAIPRSSGAAFLLRNLKVKCSNIISKTDLPQWVFRDFPQYL